jgi:peptidyl-prolyl cis-trans isomerase D
MKFNSGEVQNKDRFDEDFARFIFLEGKKGEKKVVKTKFGYHYIDITDQKNFEPAYKVAYYSKAIVASEETINTAMGLASQFAADSRNKKQFEENAKNKNINRFNALDIKPLESVITGLGESRELVRWMYEAEVGDVSERPFLVGNKYVIAILTQAYEEGTMPVEVARPQVEPIIRNKKKALEIRKRIGTTSTIEQVSKAINQPIMKADSLFFISPFIPNVGQENKVVGAAFNKQLQGKTSELISGNGGVFVIKVENITAIPNANADINQQRQAMQAQLQRSLADFRVLIEIQKKSVDIKDNRYKFF